MEIPDSTVTLDLKILLTTQVVTETVATQTRVRESALETNLAPRLGVCLGVALLGDLLDECLVDPPTVSERNPALNRGRTANHSGSKINGGCRVGVGDLGAKISFSHQSIS
jgi:hypothetical protein